MQCLVITIKILEHCHRNGPPLQVFAFETYKIKSEERQVGLQALFDQQMELRRQEVEAAANKLQHQEDVAMDRFKEMEDHLETVRKELQDSEIARHELVR